MRLLERSLRALGWVALAWVTWGWLDARLYQAQQERLFAEALATARLQRLAGGAAGAARPHEARPAGSGWQAAVDAANPMAATPLAGTRVEIEGAGPARIEVPPAPRRGAPTGTKGEGPSAPAPDPPPAAEPVTEVEEPAGLAALGRLSVPRLGIGVMISPGVDARSLRRAVGHIPGTAAPGADGNAGIAGHRDTFFRPLSRVELGDEVVLTTTEGTARYVVEWTDVVSPAAVDVLAPTPYPALTLVTCYPFYYVGHAPDRFVVRARLVEREPAIAGSGS